MKKLHLKAAIEQSFDDPIQMRRLILQIMSARLAEMYIAREIKKTKKDTKVRSFNDQADPDAIRGLAITALNEVQGSDSDIQSAMEPLAE